MNIVSIEHRKYYQAGIMLEDGATAINCKVEQFYDGFLIVNGGEVKKSEASRNHRGFVIEDIDDSSKVSKISNVYVFSVWFPAHI